MKWQAGKDKYYIQNGDFTICKIGIKPIYELWCKTERLGQFANSDLAKKHHATLTKGAQK